METTHRLRQELAAKNVNRKPLGGRQQLVVSRDQTAREIPRSVEIRRPTRSKKRIAHLAHDALEAVRNHREQNRIKHLADRTRASSINTHRSAPVSIT